MSHYGVLAVVRKHNGQRVWRTSTQGTTRAFAQDRVRNLDRANTRRPHYWSPMP